ncbi:uncharacterized protein LOC110436217 [Sorghum bicolor]|nr:uncharacterized protein LOC110436217 [Sorghum bicolor]|eukprot:XP_021318331.1 uncharacterized protein LOC110436217 [Sorghum bicolor]
MEAAIFRFCISLDINTGCREGDLHQAGCGGGKCILNSSAEHHDVKSCFVNCVLKNGCTCTGTSQGEPGGGGSAAPLPLGLPAILDKTVRVTVPRPKVSAKSPDEEEELLFELTFDPSVPRIRPIHVKLNAPRDGAALNRYSKLHSLGVVNSVTDAERVAGKAVLRYGIGKKVKDLRADGDQTIEVSFVPSPDSTLVPPTLRDVKVVYRRK